MFNRLIACINVLESEHEYGKSIKNFKEFILKKKELHDEKNFWYSFGYVYFGIFTLEKLQNKSF